MLLAHFTGYKRIPPDPQINTWTPTSSSSVKILLQNAAVAKTNQTQVAQNAFSRISQFDIKEIYFQLMWLLRRKKTCSKFLLTICVNEARGSIELIRSLSVRDTGSAQTNTLP